MTMGMTIILSNKGCGSTLIGEFFDSHEEVTSYAEIFRYFKKSSIEEKRIEFEKTKPIRYFIFEKNKDKRKYLQYVNSTGENVVFKLHYNQLKSRKLQNEILSMNIPIIHLIRKNKIKHSISRMSAGGVSGIKNKTTPKNLLKKCIKLENKDKEIRNFISKHKIRSIEIYFEDLVGKNIDGVTYMREDTNKKVCDFIGVSNTQMTSSKKKRRSENIWNYIEDRKGVTKLFKENNRSSYLEI